MSQVSRVVVNWAGTAVVGGGVTVMHCTVGGEHDLMAAFRAFLSANAPVFPDTIQWTFPTAGAVINQESGELEDAWSDSSPVTALTASGAQTWTNGVGVRAKWTTGAFYGGRAVVGSTFLVPVVVGVYEGAGNINNATIAGLQGSANTFVAAAGLRVYSRPRAGLVGQSFAVNGAQIPDKVSWLRGRRT